VGRRKKEEGKRRQSIFEKLRMAGERLLGAQGWGQHNLPLCCPSPGKEREKERAIYCLDRAKLASLSNPGRLPGE
jgi:hypothetical protein